MKSNHSPLILLCGGKSSRMGQPKGLMDYCGQLWLEHQLIQFATYGNQVTIVLGHDHEQYFQTLPYLKKAHEQSLKWNGIDLSVAINHQPELGPFSSLMAGTKKSHEKGGLFILPIDVPAPGTEVWPFLQKRGESGNLDACIPQYANLHGHPVWISHSFLLRLQKIPLDSTQARLDFQIHALPANKKAYILVADPRVSYNLNTPEDLEALKQSEGLS